jgi:hypothetical protein
VSAELCTFGEASVVFVLIKTFGAGGTQWTFCGEVGN